MIDASSNRYVVIRAHVTSGPPTVISLKPDQASHSAVEAFQTRLAREGKPTGVSWQLVDGNIIDALIASTKLP